MAKRYCDLIDIGDSWSTACIQVQVHDSLSKPRITLGIHKRNHPTATDASNESINASCKRTPANAYRPQCMLKFLPSLTEKESCSDPMI